MDTKIIKIPNENLDDYLNNFISQSTKINIAVSFFFNSGLNLIIESLKKFKNKKNINIIASNYLNSTEPNALKTLLDLKNQGANVYIYDSENSKKGLNLENISFKENKNYISVKNLIISDNFKIQSVDEVDVSFINKNKILNDFTISKDSNNYNFTGYQIDGEKLVERLIPDKEARAKAMLELKSMEADGRLKELEAQFADKDCARQMQMMAMESENASWLQRNIVPILACGTTIMIFALFFVGCCGLFKNLKPYKIVLLNLPIGHNVSIACMARRFFAPHLISNFYVRRPAQHLMFFMLPKDKTQQATQIFRKYP